VSAEILREAAALMRSRAEAATPGPWMVDDEHPHIVMRPDKPGFSWDGTAVTAIQEDDFGLTDHADAEHIASWHPAVANAVADYLSGEAAHFDRNYGPGPHHEDALDTGLRRALAVARAYLTPTTPATAGNPSD